MPLSTFRFPRQLNLAGARMRTVKAGRKTISRLRSALAVALVLWCAGAGCMLVSYARGTARGSSSSAGWGHVSGSMGAHNCCKARHKSERRVASMTDQVSSSESLTDLEGLAEVPNSSNAMGCCPLTSGTFVVTGRQGISHEDASATPGVDAVSFVTSVAATPIVIPLRLSQNQTYLRGCVFLI